jgi:hypothetical protein
MIGFSGLKKNYNHDQNSNHQQLPKTGCAEVEHFLMK